MKTGSTRARGSLRIPQTEFDCGANGGNRWMSTANQSTSTMPRKNVGVE